MAQSKKVKLVQANSGPSIVFTESVVVTEWCPYGNVGRDSRLGERQLRPNSVGIASVMNVFPKTVKTQRYWPVSGCKPLIVRFRALEMLRCIWSGVTFVGKGIPRVSREAIFVNEGVLVRTLNLPCAFTALTDGSFWNVVPRMRVRKLILRMNEMNISVC